MRNLIFMIVILIFTRYDLIEAKDNFKSEQLGNDSNHNHRENRFLILPGSVYVNSTNWSPLGSLMDTWNHLLDWKTSTVNTIKSWFDNLVKSPLNCVKQGKPIKHSIFDHFKSKLNKLKSSTKKPDKQSTTTPKPPKVSTQSNQETTTQQSTTPESTVGSSSTNPSSTTTEATTPSTTTLTSTTPPPSSSSSSTTTPETPSTTEQEATTISEEATTSESSSTLPVDSETPNETLNEI